MIWVPARLLYHAGRDADLRHFLAENMLRSGLFPAKLPAEITARHWAAIYMSCDAKVGVWQPVPLHLLLHRNPFTGNSVYHYREPDSWHSILQICYGQKSLRGPGEQKGRLRSSAVQ